jgi:hypothetical protein
VTWTEANQEQIAAARVAYDTREEAAAKLAEAF